jgi:endoglycosylceramidase
MKPFYITLFLSLLLSLSNSSFITTKDNKFYINNTQILFKGVNVVYKEFPYYPNMNKFTLNDSLVEEDFKILKNNGINCIRLGVMMAGVIPQENYINQTYLNKITEIINLGSKYDIYFLLDFHQDLLSELFCGEGIPNWLNYKLLDNKTIEKFPFPLLDKKCDDKKWIEYHFTKAVSNLFQKLYENPQYLELYWNVLALSFKDNKNVIGYELMNEPWFGDIYQNVLYLSPSYSYKYNLLPFYNKLHLF